MNLASNLALPIIALTFIGVAVGAYPGFKMNRATIAFVGAVMLVVALQVISPSTALAAIDTARSNLAGGQRGKTSRRG